MAWRTRWRGERVKADPERAFLIWSRPLDRRAQTVRRCASRGFTDRIRVAALPHRALAGQLRRWQRRNDGPHLVEPITSLF
jgi:hypothetical protein